jgi:predicted NAD-dependent protein-ADP-ribosyltransferase YbiA (DUF1768 family)
VKNDRFALPGHYRNERIPSENVVDFYKLIKFGNWRFKLHDSYIDVEKPFKLDEHFWNSVTHYIQANKFQKHYPDYYLFFTAESCTPLSKNAKLAIAAGSKSGKLNGKVIRPDTIKINKPSSKKATHYDAILAKFSQNAEFKEMLLSTLNAKLVVYKKGFRPSIANLLMLIREKLKHDTQEK